MNKRISNKFFKRDVLEVAPEIIGQYLCRKLDDGTILKYRITEVEAYRREEDEANHASKGKTARTQIMYSDGGFVYMYLIYGMYWMLNIVCGEKDDPQAILIRGIETSNGPGKLTRKLQLDKSFYGENLETSDRIWLENSGKKFPSKTTPRININYASEPWRSKPWRWVLEDENIR